MHETIILSTGPEKLTFDISDPDRIFYFSESEKKAYLYHLDHPEVDSYVINCLGLNIVEIKAIIRHIHFLNSIITIFLMNGDFGLYEPLVSSGNIFSINSEDDLLKKLKEIRATTRMANRIDWPLKASYKTKNSNSRLSADVLSISSGGCYLKTDDSHLFSRGENLGVTFHFRNFDFFSEGTVVRIDRRGDGLSRGTALKFESVSPQTESCIQSIIDEQILSELMAMLK